MVFNSTNRSESFIYVHSKSVLILLRTQSRQFEWNRDVFRHLYKVYVVQTDFCCTCYILPFYVYAFISPLQYILFSSSPDATVGKLHLAVLPTFFSISLNSLLSTIISYTSNKFSWKNLCVLHHSLSFVSLVNNSSHLLRASASGVSFFITPSRLDYIHKPSQYPHEQH